MILRQIEYGRIAYRDMTWRKIKALKQGRCSLTRRNFKKGEYLYRPETRLKNGKTLSACHVKDRMIARFVDLAMKGIG